MKYTALIAMVACASTVSAQAPAPTLTSLSQELRTLAANPEVQAAVKTATPVMQKLGVTSPFDSKLDFSPAGILNIIGTLDNSVVAFHNVVDNAGGRDAFQNGGNAVSSAYLGGLLGHLNAANVESAKMTTITSDVQAVFNQSVELFYVDLYNVLYTDLSNKLVMDALTVAGPAVKIISDIKDIAASLKELFGGNKRALFEQVEALSDEMVRVLEAGDITKENFICKLQPVIEKISEVITFLTSAEIQNDMGDLAKLLSDFPASNKVVAALQEATEAIYNFLQAYDPMIHDLVIPVVEDVTKYVEGLCAPKNTSSLRALSGDAVDKFNPLDLFTKVFDFIEKLIEEAVHFLENLPEPLTEDALKVLYDIIDLIAPEKAPYVKEIASDISDVTSEMTLLLPALNTTMGDLHVFMADSLKTIEDVKALLFDIIALFKAIIAKN